MVLPSKRRLFIPTDLVIFSLMISSSSTFHPRTVVCSPILATSPRAMPQSPSKRSLMAGPSSTSPKKHRPSAAPK
ncbi:hypothetical protein JB92DRAFT_2909645 [Gautieria morchelliformis]|nr:hypothetical protein JB92DRAFT_2909645 [Gautieria morchelliformis]